MAVLNTDAMNTWGPTRDFSIAGTARLDLLDMLIADAKSAGRTFTPDPHPETGSFYRSDHFSFAKQGVPAISFDSGNDLVKGGMARGEAIAKDYVEKAYHQPADDLTPLGTSSGMAEDAQLLHVVGERLAEFVATGPTGARTANSAPSATARQVIEPTWRLARQPLQGRKGERG